MNTNYKTVELSMFITGLKSLINEMDKVFGRVRFINSETIIDTIWDMISDAPTFSTKKLSYIISEAYNLSCDIDEAGLRSGLHNSIAVVAILGIQIIAREKARREEINSMHNLISSILPERLEDRYNPKNKKINLV